MGGKHAIVVVPAEPIQRNRLREWQDNHEEQRLTIVEAESSEEPVQRFIVIFPADSPELALEQAVVRCKALTNLMGIERARRACGWLGMALEGDEGDPIVLKPGDEPVGPFPISRGPQVRVESNTPRLLSQQDLQAMYDHMQARISDLKRRVKEGGAKGAVAAALLQEAEQLVEALQRALDRA